MRLRTSIRYRPGMRGTWMERPSTGLPGASPPGALRLDDLPQGGPAPGPLARRCPFRRITAARETGALVQKYQPQCARLRGIELGARLTLWTGMALSSGASADSLMTSKFDAVDLPFGNVSKGVGMRQSNVNYVCAVSARFRIRGLLITAPCGPSPLGAVDISRRSA